MNSSGVAIMGSATAEGEDRAIKAIELALASPLLNDNDIKGARYVLLNMEFGNSEFGMDEIAEITDYIQEEAGMEADVIWGYGQDETLEDSVRVTVVATGFQQTPNTGAESLVERPKKRVSMLTDNVATELTKPVEPKEQPIQHQTPETPEPFVKPVDPIMQSTIEFDLTQDKAQRNQTVNPEPVQTDVNEPFIRVKEEPAAEEVPTTQEPVQEYHEEPAQEPVQEPEANQDRPSQEESQSIIRNRMKKLSDISNRLRNPQAISDLENVPAYVRKQVSLGNTPHSSESQVSRFTLGEEGQNGDQKGGLRSNNSFLHDNVD
jgi:cell division protein FtsZ